MSTAIARHSLLVSEVADLAAQANIKVLAPVVRKVLGQDAATGFGITTMLTDLTSVELEVLRDHLLVRVYRRNLRAKRLARREARYAQHDAMVANSATPTE